MGKEGYFVFLLSRLIVAHFILLRRVPFNRSWFSRGPPLKTSNYNNTNKNLLKIKH